MLFQIDKADLKKVSITILIATIFIFVLNIFGVLFIETPRRPMKVIAYLILCFYLGLIVLKLSIQLRKISFKRWVLLAIGGITLMVETIIIFIIIVNTKKYSEILFSTTNSYLPLNFVGLSIVIIFCLQLLKNIEITIKDRFIREDIGELGNRKNRKKRLE